MGLRVGFVGAGQMAEALCRGFDAAGVAKCVDMTIIDRNQPRRDLFASWGCKIGASNEEVVKNVDVVFISVKPYAVADLLREMAPFLGPHVLVVSIAAGVTLATMEDAAGAGVPIMRVMPNTPCLVGCLAGAMSKGTSCTPNTSTPPRDSSARWASATRSPSPRWTPSPGSPAPARRTCTRSSRPWPTAACSRVFPGRSHRTSPRAPSWAPRRWCSRRASTRASSRMR